MLVQNENESRIDYLLRVLEYFMENTIAGEITVAYDDAFCDGHCLCQDISDAIDDIKTDHQ